jgi:hypothetical protein
MISINIIIFIDRLHLLLLVCGTAYISHNIGEHKTKQSSHSAGYAGGAKLCAAVRPSPSRVPSFSDAARDHNFGLGRSIHTFRQEAISSTAQPSASSKQLAPANAHQKTGRRFVPPTAFAILLKCLNAHVLLLSTPLSETR